MSNKPENLSPMARPGIEINATVLRVAMQERGLNQRQFAELVDVTTDTIHNWVWAKCFPQRRHFDKICEVLNISPQLLSVNSHDLVERGRTARIVRFHVRELIGENDPPDYREVQLIEADLADATERDAAEEEVREGNVAVYGEGKSSGHPESQPDSGDGKQST